MSRLIFSKPTSCVLSESPFRITQTTYPAHWEMPLHAHPYSNISIVVRGNVHEETIFGNATGTACSIVKKPLEIKHKNFFGPDGATLLNIQPGTTEIDSLFPNEELKKWEWLHAGTAPNETVSLVRSLFEEERDKDKIADNIYELMAALSARPQRSDTPPHWLIRVRDKLHDTPTYPHRVHHLAEEVGTHPVYLARVFKQYFDASIIEYLHGLRLHYAIDKVATTNHPLSEIAYISGFADQSHMGRLFKTEFQITPNSFRELVQQID